MKIATTKDSVYIELHGKEQFWSLRAKVTIDLKTITDIRYEAEFQDWRKWEVRMPGTHAPRVLLAGSYWTEDGWDFMYIKRPSKFINPMVYNVLVIETTENRYSRVIVSSNTETGKKIVNWWNKSKKTLTKKASKKAPSDKKKSK